jgi:hypothetical protein
MLSTSLFAKAKDEWNEGVETIKSLPIYVRAGTIALSILMGIVLPVFGFFATFYAISKGAQFWKERKIEKQTGGSLPVASKILLSGGNTQTASDSPKQALKELAHREHNPEVKEYLTELSTHGFGLKEAKGDGHCAFHAAADWIFSLPNETTLPVFAKIRDDLLKEKRLEPFFSHDEILTMYRSAKDSLEAKVDSPDLIQLLRLSVIYDALQQDDASNGIDTGFDPIPIEGNKEEYIKNMSTKNVTKKAEMGGEQELAALAKRFKKHFQYINLDASAKPLGAAPQELKNAIRLLQENNLSAAASAIGAAGRSLERKYLPFSNAAKMLGTRGSASKDTVEELLLQGTMDKAKDMLLNAHQEILEKITTTDYRELSLPSPESSGSFTTVVEGFSTLLNMINKAQQKHSFPDAGPDDLIVLFRGSGHYDRLT